MINKKYNIDKIFLIFLFTHLLIWTFIPSVSNINLPLDVIEALAWGSDLSWGYNKHPPVSAWFVEGFYQIFGNQDWAYYFLSQLFVVIAFFIVYEFSKDFFKDKNLSLISVLLLEGIYFFNFTTPEFNVNVCQMPFWSLTVYYCWKGLKKNDIFIWFIFGFIAAFGVLSKYLFIYLLAAIDIFFIYLLNNKKFNYKSFISIISFIIIIIPHFIWLSDNNFITFTYAFKRTGLNESQFIDHILNPLIFLSKQVGILIPFLIMCVLTISKFKTKINLKDKKFLFLFTINFVPIILMFLTSFFIGAKLRTMWMTPFYLFMGVFFVYLYKKNINVSKLKYFLSLFLILFIFSPLAYFLVSITQTDKKTDYPGKKISSEVQKNWNKNFSNKIDLVSGNEWHGGNLSYHLNSRPKWDNILESKQSTLTKKSNIGFVLIGESEILSKICVGVFFIVEKLGVCMNGEKK
jgi:4-amino-4-deoxy-L-arabinose transferase-like glycosyltransferase